MSGAEPFLAALFASASSAGGAAAAGTAAAGAATAGAAAAAGTAGAAAAGAGAAAAAGLTAAEIAAIAGAATSVAGTGAQLLADKPKAPTVTPQTRDVAQEEANQRSELYKRRGRASTLFTPGGAQGDTSSPSLGAAALLGS